MTPARWIAPTAVAVVSGVLGMGCRPVASLSAPTCVVVGQHVLLDASASYPTNGVITQYTWELKAPGLEESATTSEATLEATFPQPGRAAVSVLVRQGHHEEATSQGHAAILIVGKDEACLGAVGTSGTGGLGSSLPGNDSNGETTSGSSSVGTSQ